MMAKPNPYRRIYKYDCGVCMMEQAQSKSNSQSSVSLQKGPEPAESSTKCPSCSFCNESGALFCEECGTALHQPAHCPNCGALARLHADICEICGEWLLKGQCMFCYAPVDESETFCGECGNPAEGITCQKCGKLSHFDFCSTCNIPLSHQAKAMVIATADDPAFLEIAALFEGLADIGITDDSSVPEYFGPVIESVPKPVQPVNFASEEALRLKVYRESQQKSKQEHPRVQPSQPKSLFSSDQKERISQLDGEVFQEEERRRIEEERRQEEERLRLEEIERRRREEEERKRLEEERKRVHEQRLQQQLNDALNKFRGKTFSSNQEARRFFMSIIAGLPEELAKKITNRGMGWRCNAYDCVHDSPENCADPSRGGVWLVR